MQQLDQYLRIQTARLQEAGIDSARLDCLILLEDALSKDRAWILANPDHILETKVAHEIDEQLDRRAKHEPLAYIRSRSEFYGNTFFVNQHVLEPRPETESIINSLLQLINNTNSELPEAPTIIDVGTGSGALAITAKLQLPQANVIGTDIDPKCLDVARKNATNLHTDVSFIEANLIQSAHASPAPLKADILLANLPYVPEDFAINKAAGFEPRLAIFGGEDGMDLFRMLFAQVQALELERPTYVITEALPTHHSLLAMIAEKAGYGLSSTAGFTQVYERITR